MTPITGSGPTTLTVTATPGTLASGIYTGKVIVGSSSLGQAAVSVTLVVVGSTGDAPLVVDPASLTFTAATGAAAPTATVKISSGRPTTTLGAFTVTVTGEWLKVTPASGTGPSSLTVTATPGTMSAGTYTGRIVVSAAGFLSAIVPVTLQIGGTSSEPPKLSISPDALFFRTTGPAAQTGSIKIASSRSTSPLGAFTAAASTKSGGSWLAVSPTSGTGPSTLTVTATPGTLAAGEYSGSIVIGAVGFAGPVTVPVVLQVMASTGSGALFVRPDELEFDAVVGGPVSNPVALAVYNPAGDSFNWTATATVSSPSGGSWLKITPASGTGKGSINVTVDPKGLVAGEYSGKIAVTSGAATVNVEVSLEVTAPRPTKLVVAPPAISFQPQEQDGKTPDSRSLEVNNGGGTSLNWTATATVNTPTGGKWLSISPTSGSTPGKIVVKTDVTGLAPGDYNGKVTVTAGTVSVDVPVYLRVAGAKSSVVVQPRELIFTATGGVVSPPSLDVSVTSTATGLTFTATPSTGKGTNWLSVTPTTGGVTTSSKFSASVLTSAIGSLLPGVYTGQIEVKVAGATQESKTVHVALKIFGPGESARLDADPDGVTFKGVQGGANPAAAKITLEAEGIGAAGIPWTAAATTTKGGSWLSATPASGTATPATPSSISISANIAGLAPDIYTGTVVFTPTSSAVSPVHVAVMLVVTKAGASAATDAVTGAAAVAAGPLIAVYTTPEDGFITQLDLPLNVRVKVLDSTGSPVTGANVVVRSSHSEPPLTLEDAGGGEYAGVFQALASGSLNLTASAQIGSQSAPDLTISGDMEAAQSALTLIFQNGGVSAASFAAGVTPLAPGSLMSLFGLGIAGPGGAAPSIPLTTSLNGVSVTIGGKPAPLVAAVPGTANDQINLQIPFEIDGQSRADVVVNNNGVISKPETITLGVAPAIFTLSNDGTGAGAILHGADFSLVSAASPARAGETLVIYATGLGAVASAVASGSAATGPDAITGIAAVTIGNQSATVTYAGLAPSPVGCYQLNVVMPGGLATGDQAVVVSVNGSPATGRATVSVK